MIRNDSSYVDISICKNTVDSLFKSWGVVCLTNLKSWWLIFVFGMSMCSYILTLSFSLVRSPLQNQTHIRTVTRLHKDFVKHNRKESQVCRGSQFCVMSLFSSLSVLYMHQWLHMICTLPLSVAICLLPARHLLSLHLFSTSAAFLLKCHTGNHAEKIL